jgi:hypothetical protein
LFREFVAAKRRVEDDAERDMVSAWEIANLTAAARVGKLPPIDELISRRRQAKTRLSPAAQRSQLAMVSEHIGVAIRPLSDAAKHALARLKEMRGK